MAIVHAPVGKIGGKKEENKKRKIGWKRKRFGAKNSRIKGMIKVIDLKLLSARIKMKRRRMEKVKTIVSFGEALPVRNSVCQKIR